MQNDYVHIAKELILSNIDTEKYNVFLFGSRATNSNKNKFSDIDVGILGKEKLSALTKLTILDEIGESNVPLKVDIVDFCDVSDSFKKEALKKIIIWNQLKDINIV